MFELMKSVGRDDPVFGSQWVLFFENGYGASVIKGPYSYGGPQGLYELAVLKGTEEEYELTYSTEITDDVMGNLTILEVNELLKRIKELC